MAALDRKKQVRDVLRILSRQFPAPKCALNFGNVFELLAATILSAQTTDAQVNKITPALFAKYPEIADYASAPLDELKSYVSSVNFFNNKAANIQGSARMVLAEFGGVVPSSMQELVRLPGVARKTANIILSTGYGVIEGIAVDTHVKRISKLLGLTTQDDPVKIERDLMDITPRDKWPVLSHVLILHGRKTCSAKKPLCPECPLNRICPSA